METELSKYNYSCFVDIKSINVIKKKKEKTMSSDKITKKETMINCRVGILAPTATKETTTIFKDEANNEIFVKVKEDLKKEDVFEDCDFSIEEKISIDKRYDVSTTSCSIKDGLIILTIKTNKDIKRVEIE